MHDAFSTEKLDNSKPAPVANEIAVAHPTPATPSMGNGPIPKISNQLNKILKQLTMKVTFIGVLVSPRAPKDVAAYKNNEAKN